MANSNDTYGGEENLALGMARDLAVWQTSYSFLDMLRKGWDSGYYIPGTRTKIARQLAMGRLGKRGVMVAKPVMNRGLKRMYEEAGILGIAGARKAAIATYGRQAAGSAAAKFLVSKAAGLYIGYTWVQLAWLGATATIAGYKGLSSAVTKYRGLEMGGYFPESQGAYTSRQRAVQAITASQLQARSAIGNEAMLLHR